MSEPLLQAVDLQCERDDRELFRALNFTIAAGTLTRVEGPNGSGKTTLLRILAGLNDSFSGRLLWQGSPVMPGARNFCAIFFISATGPVSNPC